MKWLMVILSLVLVVKPLTPFIEYAVNKDYIAEVLCINREKPEMECDGKCYLMSSVEDEMDKDAPAQKGSTRIQMEVILAFLQKPFEFKAYTDCLLLHQRLAANYSFNYSFLTTSDIESPPWMFIG